MDAIKRSTASIVPIRPSRRRTAKPKSVPAPSNSEKDLGWIGNNAPSKAPPRWLSARDIGIYHPPFYISKLLPMSSVDLMTRRWIRNAADERAAQEGYRMSERRGQYTVDWISTYCILYEGESKWVGKPMQVEDWQYEYLMQVFGWVQNAPEYGRWIRRFTHAGVWIPKKNGKSPTLAATGLYMLMGDGELGQKCYSVARDGKQAMIAHEHAMQMVKMSPDLMDVCKLNATTGTITHLPTRSKYIVVSGDKGHSQSTEGYNGSLFVDETHVVDQKQMDRLKRAGISRSEPLHVEMSTAGDSVDGYGLARYEYGKQCVQCERNEETGVDHYNPQFYFLDFSVPQDTPIEKLRDRDYVLKMGETCNPTLGRVLTHRGFEADWRESIQSQTELRKFAMYRLNLWTKAGANWIEVEDWLACKRKYTLAQLRKFPCVAGLDLSKTRDMTALSLMFAVPDDQIGIRPYTWTWQWIPESTAMKYSSKVDLWRWVDKNSSLLIVPGTTVDYQLVAQRLQWVVDNFDCHGIGYDPYYANRLMNILYNEYGWTEEMMLSVKQNMPTLAPATGELERLILRKEIVHNGNPVVTWQFGHCQVKEDGMGNKMPMKPTKDDYRKIDGVASLVNATAMFYADESIQAGYDESILLFRKRELEEQENN